MAYEQHGVREQATERTRTAGGKTGQHHGLATLMLTCGYSAIGDLRHPLGVAVASNPRVTRKSLVHRFHDGLDVDFDGCRVRTPPS
jgi:hypothetical protein